MTAGKDKRTAEMEALLRDTPGWYVSGDKEQTAKARAWIERRDAVLAPTPDPDAVANEINVLYNVLTKSTRPVPLSHGYWRDFCRAVAVWTEARVRKAKRDLLLEAIERLGNDVAGQSVIREMLTEIEEP